MDENILSSLQAYYSRTFPARQDPHVCNLASITAGWEHEMCRFDVEYGPPEHRRFEALVLRIYPGARAVEKSMHEFYSMRRLHEAGYPVPYVHVLEYADSPIGKPFVIMERIEGKVLGELLTSSAPERRRELRNLFCKLLVRLHRMEWRPFADDDVSYDRQGPYAFVDWYLAGQREVLRQHSLPGFLPVVEWLQDRHDHVPCRRPSIVHGDFHPYNILVRDDGSAMVVDWTALHVSDPRVDLAWMLLLVKSHGGVEQCAYILQEYEDLTEGRVEHLEWFETLACLWRLRTIAVAFASGAQTLGWRPEATAIAKEQMQAIKGVYQILLERTGIHVKEVEAFLA